MRFRAALSLVALLAAAGCAGDDETATVTEAEPAVVRLYFLRDGRVAPVARGITGSDLRAATIEELFQGPEPGDGELKTAIPSNSVAISITAAGNDVWSIGVSRDLSPPARAQIVYTLTQFPNVRRVEIGEAPPVGRRAFENQTPAILVESPLPGESVESGFEVTGTANTFEATFNYELQDESGAVLAKDFVTATSGSGTRGTFRFTVEYDVPSTQQGRLVVFEISAADGSRTHESSVPLTLR